MKFIRFFFQHLKTIVITNTPYIIVLRKRVFSEVKKQMHDNYFDLVSEFTLFEFEAKICIFHLAQITSQVLLFYMSSINFICSENPFCLC